MPGDYVSELAARAFRKLEGGESREFVKAAREPVDAGSLENELNLRADLQAHAAAMTGYTPSKWLLEHELTVIGERRKNLKIECGKPDPDPYRYAADSGLMGLCFSGGGIRSATFNLGVLQGLAQLRLLRCFDYLSSVSGGGYIHQWLAAWSKRRGFDAVIQQLIPLPEKDN